MKKIWYDTKKMEIRKETGNAKAEGFGLRISL